MELIYNTCEYEYVLREQNRKRRQEAIKRSPEQDAKRESDGHKRVAFIKALIAAGRLDEWLASPGGRLTYLAMCEELGIEPAGIDE